jgi:murein DD-endopeptidase MepM/ murein hydrolase activator NlpD
MQSKDVLGWELLVASNKPDLTSADDYIQPGQKLRIPTASGLVHTVILDETVGDLADIFDVSSAAIIEANRLENKDLVTTGQVLLIPNPGRTAPPPPPDPAPVPAPQPEPPSAPPGAPPPNRPSASGFIWPITARANITSYFGPRHPLGIDLGLAHARGSSIVAAASGKVVFAGGNACCSYGLYVIVDHGNGLKTLYAHLSRLDVRAGQWVDRGDSLGPSGSTGYSTGPHLHFEVHRNGVRVNPLSYLP